MSRDTSGRDMCQGVPCPEVGGNTKRPPRHTIYVTCPHAKVGVSLSITTLRNTYKRYETFGIRKTMAPSLSTLSLEERWARRGRHIFKAICTSQQENDSLKSSPYCLAIRTLKGQKENRLRTRRTALRKAISKSLETAPEEQAPVLISQRHANWCSVANDLGISSTNIPQSSQNIIVVCQYSEDSDQEMYETNRLCGSSGASPEQAKRLAADNERVISILSRKSSHTEEGNGGTATTKKNALFSTTLQERVSPFPRGPGSSTPNRTLSKTKEEVPGQQCDTSLSPATSLQNCGGTYPSHECAQHLSASIDASLSVTPKEQPGTTVTPCGRYMTRSMSRKKQAITYKNWNLRR